MKRVGAGLIGRFTVSVPLLFALGWVLETDDPDSAWGGSAAADELVARAWIDVHAGGGLEG
jgi:hypothetical protein